MKKFFIKREQPVFPLSEATRSLHGAHCNYVRDMIKQQILKKKYDKTPVILLTTGSYNPAHTEHVMMMKKAANELEENHNKAVVAVIISPSHDSYVRRKLGSRQIDGYHRYHILMKTVEDMVNDIDMDPSLCFVDTWELQQERFCDHPVVMKNLRAYMQDIPGLEIWYGCGADLYSKCCGLCNGHSADGVVVVSREGSALRGAALKTVESTKNHILIDSVAPKSSTEIRDAGVDSTVLADLMSPSALEYYIKNVVPTLPKDDSPAEGE
eukprot:TRINITY_DN754_c7_g1_i2.p1 TRINITY_DN754_c7_g1~~TRINITY_DN754_c7_g1_i2.p1  ORF type:complete len:310 (+),score=39.88 TRINITY_DN754_c7_g1_i2:127-930(+)